MEVKNSNSLLDQEDLSQNFNIKEFLSSCLLQWKWFVVSVLLFLALGYVFLRKQPTIYQSNASVLIKQEGAMPEEMMLLQDLGFKASKNNIDNEIGVFKSPDLMAKIVTKLGLYTTYNYKSRFGFYAGDLYKNTPMTITWEGVNPLEIGSPVVFECREEENQYSFQIHYRDSVYYREIAHFPNFIELPFGRFFIAKNESVTSLDRPLMVTIQNAERVARTIASQLTVSTSAKQSSLLELSIRSRSPQWGQDVLQALIDAYNEDASTDKNMAAANTARFIDERLKDISSELSSVEGKVESYQKQQGFTDLGAETQLYMGYTGSNESKRIEIETQLNLIRYIEDFLRDPKNNGMLIPNIGISDTGLLTSIGGYNQAINERDKLALSTSKENPMMQKILAQIEGLRQGIQVSLANQRNASEIALKEIDRQAQMISAKKTNMPTIQRQYNDVLRQQGVKNSLFVFLLQKREEVSLTLAGIAPKAKLISKAYSLKDPVAPRGRIIFIAFFLLGFFLPAAVLFSIDIFHTTIRGMKDLDPLKNVPVIGDVAKIATSENGVALQVKSNDDSMIGEMFRTLRNNLLFMMGKVTGEGKVILLTSTIQKEGKTFVSVNLAKSISLMDKRVLLVGSDLRNPQINNSLGLPRSKRGLSTYLAGIDSDLSQLIVEMTPTFHVLAGGAVPPNPNELLSASLLDEFVEEMRKKYDYILFDTAPVGIVSDTFLLNRFADRVVYVIREGYSRKDTVEFINNMQADGRLSHLSLVLNGTSMSSARYGKYNYKYKYKYSYRYRYGQGHTKA